MQKMKVCLSAVLSIVQKTGCSFCLSHQMFDQTLTLIGLKKKKIMLCSDFKEFSAKSV